MNFDDVVHRVFLNQLHHYDTEMADYLAELLVDFTFVDRLCRIREAQGGVWKTWGRCSSSPTHGLPRSRSTASVKL
jgi:hypothetical protein